ncbi:AfsR/SARP family transcriptional regulator [Amycolatopsis magusensis]|uniref:AfsR/SARP family transcriptional regulator n=1 Tax=Amycolatopsis magusensis TaxID=882444 RepID=UPI0027E26037|nr:BTAD domain-containing putative transcriptional regulator [Amycolatopsis magusensis]
MRLLGEVTIRGDGGAVDLGPARQRCVLAALVVDAPRLVPAERVVKRVWGERAPSRGRKTLYSYISRLRQAVSAIDAIELVSRSGGYALALHEPVQVVDLHRFRDLRARARALPDDEQAAALLTEALALWRGDPLTGLTGDWAEAERDRLQRERWDCEGDLTDRLLRSGHGDELVADLVLRATAAPLDERVAGQYLLALHRAGRPADALAHYRQLRERLVREIGTDPGTALQELHQRILADDPALARPPGNAAPVVVPRQLPAAPAPFVGREHELERLDAALRHTPAGTVVITAIAGAGGFGKTWLALHWAHRHAAEFPDGQLFVDLRGFSPDGQPMAPAVAVRGFLDALGVEPGRIPADPHAQAGLFRSLVVDKKMLLVLDNAAGAEQLTTLLPGGPASTVLVTSRDQLPGLIAGHGAQHLRLDTLSGREARDVLVRRLGPARVAAEPAAVDELIELCGGLPLALSIVAGQLHTRPDLPLAAFAADLRDLGLGALDDDPAAGLPTVLSWSYRALSAEQAEVFSLLGTASGPDISLTALISLTGLAPDRARKAVRALERASLLKRDPDGRVRMHDLIRRYATETALRLPVEVREAASRRLADHYLHTAYAADLCLDQHRGPLPLDPPAPGVHLDSPADTEAALAWFGTEHACLLATQRQAAAHRWHQVVWHLAWGIDTFHYWRGHWHDRLAVWQAAADAHLTDPTMRTIAHRLLGRAHAELGHHDEADAQLRQALEWAEQHPDPIHQARAHHALAKACGWREDGWQALAHARLALDLFRRCDQPIWEGVALNAVGWFAAQVDELDVAQENCEAALALFRRLGDREGEAGTLDSLGYVHHRGGRHQEAIDHYREALAGFRELGFTSELVVVLDHLGQLRAALGEHDHARTAWEEARDLYLAQGREDDAARIQQQLNASGREHRTPIDTGA